MSGFFESRLEVIARAPRYGDEWAHSAARVTFESAARTWRKAAADPGFTGKTGAAASAAFATSASHLLSHVEELARLPSLVSAANATLDEAWNLLDALPPTSNAEHALALAVADVARGGAIASSTTVTTAYAGLRVAQTAREAAAQAAHAKLVARLQHTQQSLHAVAATLGFTSTDAAGGGSRDKPSLEEILVKYQIADDPRDGGELRLWAPWGIPHEIAKALMQLLGLNFNIKMTAKEKDMLESLWAWDLKDAYEIQKSAQAVAAERFPSGTDRPGNYDRNDAFRHTYWSALLTRRFGPDWAEEFTSAHEGYRSNPGPAEAMDLYNNEMGRTIAMQHPHVTDQELAELVERAARNGDLITIGEDERLRWSDYEGPHPVPESFDELFGIDSLPGRDRAEFGIDDRRKTPIPRSGSGYWQ